MEHKYPVLFVAILILGIFLRIYQLDTESLWADEVFSLHHAQEDLGSMISLVSTTEAAPPLSYIFLHYWTYFFGNSEFAARFPSMIWGVWSILILFKIVNLFFDQRTALLASALMSISMLQVLFSQEARMYSLFTFFSLLSAYFFFRIYLKKSKNYFWYGLFTLLAGYTNYLAFFLPLFYSFYLLWRKVEKSFYPHWWRINLWLFFLAWPILPVLYKQFSAINNGLAETLAEKGIPAALSWLGLFFFALPLLAVLAFLAFLLWLQKRNKLPRWHLGDGVFLLLWGIFGIFYIYLSFFPLKIFGITLITVPITNSYFLIRHSFFLAPLFYVYIAFRIGKMPGKTLRTLCLVFLVVVSSASLGAYYSTPTKAQWKEAAAYLGERPLVLLDKGGFSNAYLLRYYGQNPAIVKLTWSEEERKSYQINEEELQHFLDRRSDFWLVLARNPSGDYYKDWLDQRYVRDAGREFYQIKAYHYRNMRYESR